MSSEQWGRVDDDGTVYVRTADGERPVGQYPAGTPEEALEFFTKRYEALVFEVDLLIKRITAAKMSPDEAAESIKTVTRQVREANAVGDLASLEERLVAVAPLIAEQRDARRAEKAQRAEESRAAKERIAEEAEGIAEGKDWRNGANRLRDLLQEWKALPRLDRASDDALWRRFSTARTAYTRRRKAHFAELHEKREAAKGIKERLIEEAEAISGSTDWGPTSRRYRDLMQQWKAAGPAPRNVDEALWRRFRAAQDTFFGARDAANAEIDREYAANAEVKDELIVAAEALVPRLEDGEDLDTLKREYRTLADKWDAAGKVPRDRVKELEGRMRAVEQAIRKVEDAQWRRTDPEKSARADDMITKLESAIAEVEEKVEKARAAGDERQVKKLEDDLASRRMFLETARKASAEFS